VASPKAISLLGSTGSIGAQTLDVVDAFPDRFRVVALACRSSADAIIEQARRHRPDLVAVADDAVRERVGEALRETDIEVASGPDALVRCAVHPEADMVVAAAVGISGLLPVWEAVGAGKAVAIANKEPLVVAGHLIAAAASRTGAQLLPVDSEHSAIFQSLLGQDRSAVARVTLTASGGAFRDVPQAELERVTPEEALAHPTWKMGPKVTVDSATLMNKGLELIEARWLFGLGPEQLGVVLHRESIVHSLVEFADGAVIAHLARPDMRIPIQFALSYPERLPRSEPAPDLASLGSLQFEAFSPERWPCVRLAQDALAAGGTAPAVLNAADEVAVDWFLGGRIAFTRIPGIIEDAMTAQAFGTGESIEALMAADAEARQYLARNQDTWTR
jgi:1-deoxy-D-xylulose-5-phosphate reductoisomerase